MLHGIKALCTCTCIALATLCSSGVAEFLATDSVLIQRDDVSMTPLQARYHGSLCVLAEALERHCGGLASWTLPRAGMFLWVKLLVCADANDLLAALVEDKVRDVLIPLGDCMSTL
jgi:DNA-binding transcriptional MocR family regulator